MSEMSITLRSGRMSTSPIVRRDGGELESGQVAEILAKARAGVVDSPIEIEARVYRQKLGEPLTPGHRGSQQNILFRPRSMRAFARTFRSRPFLDGHEWGRTIARGGTILDSWAAVEGPDVESSETRIVQTLEASEPWAVAGILAGTINEFSIGFTATGSVLCSIHKSRIWSKCYCYPGERYGDEPADGEDDTRPVVQWLIESGDGLEVSAVNVPAVGNGATGIDAIRLSATGLDPVAVIRKLARSSGLIEAEVNEGLARARALGYVPNIPADCGHRRSKPPMKNYAKLAAALSLTAQPGDDLDEDRALAAVNGLSAERDLWRARAENAEGQLAASAAAESARVIDSEIDHAYASGRLMRTLAADGKTSVADPQEAPLRVLATSLGVDQLRAMTAAMPIRGAAKLRSITESVRSPAPTVDVNINAAAAERVGAKLGHSAEEMAASAALLGKGR